MKLKESVETETFISRSGYYTIKQERPLDDDHIVSLTPAQMRHIIKDMQEWLKDESWHSDLAEEG